ncbi:hydrogenase maturation protease [bacterium]|nr:hydrogenase maturation protease [bacterium]
MPRTLIIGYGNTLRRDDAAGVIAAETLQRELEGQARVRVVARHQLTPELAADLAESDRALFIDAAAKGEPGTISLQRITPPPPSSSPLEIGHNLTPATLLALARDIYGSHPSTWILTVTGRDFDLQQGISTDVRDALPKLLDRARRWM